MSPGDRSAVGRLVWLALVGALVVTVAASAASGGSVRAKAASGFTATDLSSAATETISVPKSDSGRLAQTDPSLLGRTDSTPINVMIKYDYDSTASYAGGVDGLAATSPRVTGKKLKDNRAAVNAYEAHTAALSDKITADIEQAVPGATIRESFQTVYGGVEAQVPANSVADLLKVNGVVAVQQDALQQPLDDNTAFIGATKVWPQLGGATIAGSNVTVGVIDTGVWPEHPMLSPTGIPAPAGGLKGCQFGDGSDAAHLGPPFACNNKLIGAYAFTNTYMNAIGSDGQEFCNNTTKVCSPRDPEGHGTHTTTTAAGDCVSTAVLYGVERGPVCGIAPGAHVIMYRVCLAQGCFNSDSVAAVQQAILDGVDVINFSISGGKQPYTDPVELAFLDAVNAGISVNASAGNSGPGAGTSDHGGPWTTTVGASTGPRFFTSTLHLTADGGATFDKAGVTLTNGISSPTAVVLAENIPGEDALCQTKLSPLSPATGKIVACERGVNARVDKGFNVFSGGAVGMILYNTVKQDVETDNHWLPAIHIDGPNADLLNFINTHTNVMATWAQGAPTATQPDVMAAFSSRGPTGDWIKPDVTAPGIQVLAGMTPQPDETTPTNGPPGNLYQAIAGTSMSSPHAAGVSALVKAVHPDWTPEEIKSALMTSSVQSVVKEDGTTPATPFDMGAGSIRADRAVNPTLVFNETFADFVAAGTDPLHRIDLNLPSVDAPTFLGSITTQRTAINVTGQNQVLKVSTVAPAGATITVGTNNGNLSVKAGGSITFPITINGPTLASGQYFGRITLDPQKPGATTVTIPVAFVKKSGTAGAVGLTHSCAPTTFPVGANSHCTVTASNFAPVTANVNVTVSGSPGLHYSNVSAPATLIPPHFGAQWSGTLTPSLPPTVDSITSTTEFPYLPLSLFGIPPISGVGDDTITNFNVPTFYYGGEPYTRIGVVSNGYVVIGGGTASDVVFLPQTFPNPARPNNVVAPLWNDLNPPAGGAIRIATLTDGSNTWIVIDYDHVKNFSNATTHTMELWFRISGGAAGTGPASEQTTISYGAANTASPDPGSGGNSGAENRDGTSGKNLTTPADNTEWRVNTSPPTPGGTVSFTYDASADTPKTYDSIASMTSNVTPGTTEVAQTLTVTP
jgi:subtilisin family serine protease